MIRRRFLGLAMTVGSALTGSLGEAVAQTAKRIPPAAATTIARERFEGDVLDVRLDDAEDDEAVEEIYEVKLLTQRGIVIRVRIDAESGRYLSAAGDDLASAIRRPGRSR